MTKEQYRESYHNGLDSGYDDAMNGTIEYLPILSAYDIPYRQGYDAGIKEAADFLIRGMMPH